MITARKEIESRDFGKGVVGGEGMHGDQSHAAFNLIWLTLGETTGTPSLFRGLLLMFRIALSMIHLLETECSRSITLLIQTWTLRLGLTPDLCGNTHMSLHFEVHDKVLKRHCSVLWRH
jgi:hypothetical protein